MPSPRARDRIHQPRPHRALHLPCFRNEFGIAHYSPSLSTPADKKETEPSKFGLPTRFVVFMPAFAEASQLRDYPPVGWSGILPMSDAISRQCHVPSSKIFLRTFAAGPAECSFATPAPPGAGQPLLARAIPSILPALTLEESLEITRIYSVSDMLPSDSPRVRHRPFRAPHHTISHAGLVGGGRWPHPGEISLAHRGVLFLDELPEFDSRSLEMMRQPLEDRVVTISRAQGTLTFPANFQLVAAMNPCPRGRVAGTRNAYYVHRASRYSLA